MKTMPSEIYTQRTPYVAKLPLGQQDQKDLVKEIGRIVPKPEHRFNRGVVEATATSASKTAKNKSRWGTFASVGFTAGNALVRKYDNVPLEVICDVLQSADDPVVALMVRARIIDDARRKLHYEDLAADLDFAADLEN